MVCFQRLLVLKNKREDQRSFSHLQESIVESQHKFLYRTVAEMAIATNRLPVPTRYFIQFQKKGMFYKAKDPIEEGVNLEEILKRILVGEI